MPIRMLASVPVRDTRADVMIRFLQHRAARSLQTVVFFANANFVEKCRGFAPVLSSDPDIFVLNDGIALDLASRMVYGAPFRENLNGTDFVPRFLASAMPMKVYLLGGSAPSVERAAQRLGTLPQVRIVGTCDGTICWSRHREILDDIETAKPDVILVALGNPLQEVWVLHHKHRLGNSVIFCVGALFDYLSGEKRRAPPILRRFRLEWCYRLAHEPRRLLRRYTLDTAVFFLSVLRDSRKQRHAGRRA